VENRKESAEGEKRGKTDSFLSRVQLCRFRQRSYRSKSNKGATLIIGSVSRARALAHLLGYPLGCPL